jgi:uncharacterized membrane protein YraQ (UPF0718 family)
MGVGPTTKLRSSDRHVRSEERNLGGVGVVAAVVVAAAVCRPLLEDVLDRPAVANWATVFVAIAVQAMPFLVLGVAISAAVAAFVPPGFLPRALPRRPALAVPAAAAAGAALPGCECGSVPIAGRLVAQGAPPAAALAFLLSAPAVNPVVLVATAVAFPGRPEVVLAIAGLAVVMAICSEADAFVAASLTQFSPVARLVFMVVGPMVDVKLIALQAGTFGGRFAARFAPLTFAAAVGSSVLVGWWLL